MQAAAQRILELSALSVMIHKLWIIQFPSIYLSFFHLLFFLWMIFQRFFLPKLNLIKSEKVQKQNKNFVWKNFPEILLSHHPKIVNFNFYLKSCILEKFSKNSPESWPKFLKMAFGKIFQKTSWVTTRIFRCDQFWTQIIKKGNLRGLLWYHA